MKVLFEPAGRPLLIVGCTRRKRLAQTPIPALELYEGGCVPQLRNRIGDHVAFRCRVRFLSAEHGLVDADRPLLPYDRALTDQRAADIHTQVRKALHHEIEMSGMPKEVLVVASARYQSLVTAALAGWFACPRVRTVSDVRDWAAVSAILDTWSWP